MVERNVRPAEQIGNADFGCRSGGHAGERADLNHLVVDLERPGDRPQHSLDVLFQRLAAVIRQVRRYGELVAAHPRDNRTLACLLEDGDRDAPEQFVADVIAMAIVDGPETMKLDRDDQQRACVLSRLHAHGLRAIGEPLAIEKAGHRVGGSGDRGAALAVQPPFRLMLQVDVSTPAEEDECDVKGQGNCCDLGAGTEDDLGAGKLAEERRAVSDEQDDSRHDGSENDPVVARAVERRSAQE